MPARGLPGTPSSAVDESSRLEAVLLLRRTGTLIACWSRNGTAQDVVSVMAATLCGSIDTMVGALGNPAPSTVFIETDIQRMLLARVGSQNLLLLVAARSVPRSVFRRALGRIRSTFSATESPEARSSVAIGGFRDTRVEREPMPRSGL